MKYLVITEFSDAFIASEITQEDVNAYMDGVISIYRLPDGYAFFTDDGETVEWIEPKKWTLNK